MRQLIFMLAAVICALMSFGTLASAGDPEAVFKIGTRPLAIPSIAARQYARNYLAFAAHAVESYRDLTLEEKTKTYLLSPWGATTDRDSINRRITADQQLQRESWLYTGGYSGALLCQGDLACAMRPIPVKGLAYQFWRRGNCRQVVIAFRGTDPLSSSDWYSNFRWVTRFLPFADEYDQVRQNINKIIDDARASTHCPDAPIITVGHSLGGGLAQLAAYSHGGITRVYAFDPSPVTAYYDVDQLTRQRDTKDLIIDRVYEKGELLALPRRITDSFFQPSVCNPQVRTVEFNTITGLTFAINPVTQHSIERLMVGLVDFVKGVRRQELQPALLRQQVQDAADCAVVAALAKGQRIAKSERQRIIAGLRPQDATKQFARTTKEQNAASR